MTFRDDRFECVTGEELMVDYKLKENSPTRRVVASCCNSAMFLKYAPGFWVSTYRARFDKTDLPPLELRTFIRYRQSDIPLQNDIPRYRGIPTRLYINFFLARAAMLLGW